MLSSEYEVFEDITDTVEQALADKKIRMECEARERYERDRISLYASGRKIGKTEGFTEGFTKGFTDGFTDAVVSYIQTLRNDNISKEDVIFQIIKFFNLSEQDATALVDEHWK